MKDYKPADSARLAEEYRRLVAAQQTLLLSTCSLEGKPDIGYAPYVRSSEEYFYIFVSALATHTQNLLQNPQASVLFIEQETGCRNLFARERVVYLCSANRINPDLPNYERQLDALQDRFGETVALLRTLPDFHLFELRPASGRYVAGFGQAYAIDPNGGELNLIRS